MRDRAYHPFAGRFSKCAIPYIARLTCGVANDPVARGSLLSTGSLGWSGAYGTHFWVDPKEKIVGIVMIQTPHLEIRGDFENSVMQAFIGGTAAKGTN